MTSRNYVFTLNNPNSGELEALRSSLAIKYCCWQTERGATGTEHLQGYVEFIRPFRIKGAKRALGCDRYHLEPRMGTRDQAIAYCSKAATRVGPFEEVNPENRGLAQGTIPELRVVARRIADGEMDIREVGSEYPHIFVRHFRGLERLYELTRAVPTRNAPMVCIVWGPTGTGKSHYINAEAGPNAFWLTRPQNGSEYMLGYEDEENIVIDEFYGWIRFGFLLRLLDKFKLIVNTQGGRKEWKAKKIWMASNKPWRLWYPGVEELAPLERRITKVIHMDKLPGVYASMPVAHRDVDGEPPSGGLGGG